MTARADGAVGATSFTRGQMLVYAVEEPQRSYLDFGRSWIEAIRPDGEGRRQLTPTREQAGDPALSPTGEIAYETNSLDPRAAKQIRVRENGAAGSRTLTRTGYDNSPSYSADGKTIAFVSYRHRREGRIFAMNADGTDQRQLTDPPSGYSHYSPSISPDGATVAFTEYDGLHDARICVVAIGGGEPRCLTRARRRAQSYSPSYSPDGATIAYERVIFRPGRSRGKTFIYLMRSDGSGQRRLTDGRFNRSDPVFSPDGRRIAFIRWKGSGHDYTRSQVAVVRADGTGERLVTRTKRWKSQVDWR